MAHVIDHREAVIVKERDDDHVHVEERSTGLGTIILVILAVLVIAYLLFGGSMFGGSNAGTNAPTASPSTNSAQ